MSARVLEWLLDGEMDGEPRALAYIAGGVIGVALAAAVVIGVVMLSLLPG